MKRRAFLAAVAAYPVANAAAAGKIAALEFWRFEGRYTYEAGTANRQFQTNPLHIYDALRPKEYKEQGRPAGESKTSALYLKLRTDSGLEGLYGPIDEEAAVVVHRQLRPFLLGKEALAGEALWDQLYRSNRHSRSSHFMMAISAVDNALWDLRGRYFKAPVYSLLGGPTRPAVQVYGSCLGFSVEPEFLKKKCVQLKQQGFMHQKWFMPYGPGDGAVGMEKNVAIVRNLREAMGYDVDIMFDAFMGWDLNYALQWAKQVEQYRPRWIEEAFTPDKLESFAALRRATSVPVATGEHFYGRWETKRYLDAQAITVVQADPEWCGGVSELVKICHIASAYDAHVIPHGHGVHAAMHVVASQSPMTCPLVEYLIPKMSTYHHFEKWNPTPVNGKITLPETPGFGIIIDDAKVEKRTQVIW